MIIDSRELLLGVAIVRARKSHTTSNCSWVSLIQRRLNFILVKCSNGMHLTLLLNNLLLSNGAFYFSVLLDLDYK